MFRSRYFRHVGETFDRLLGGSAAREHHELESLRMIVFSDHHRGDGSGADDFVPCEATYTGALGHYFSEAYKLVLLGDVEELWEAAPSAAVASYEGVLAAEKHFADAGRYLRVWGNHDDEWSFPGQVEAYLRPWVGGHEVQEAFSVTVTKNGSEIGRVFLVHGHQGTLASDRAAALSRWAVRYLWRPVQRLLGVSLEPTPSRDYSLRCRHERAMYRWAQVQDRLVLVTGHTHHPVFCSHSHESQLEADILALEKRLSVLPGAAPQREALLAEREALRETLVHKRATQSGGATAAGLEAEPCYFNSGCCSFADGDITGLELADGEVRLVRWSRPHGAGSPARTVLRRAALHDVFRRCARENPSGAERDSS